MANKSLAGPLSSLLLDCVQYKAHADSQDSCRSWNYLIYCWNEMDVSSLEVWHFSDRLNYQQGNDSPDSKFLSFFDILREFGVTKYVLEVLRSSYSLCPADIVHCFSQSASGTCGFLVMAQMRSGRSRRLAPQRLTNRWAIEGFVSVGHVRISLLMVHVKKPDNCWLIILYLSIIDLFYIVMNTYSGPNCLYFSFQRMALIRKTTKK